MRTSLSPAEYRWDIHLQANQLQAATATGRRQQRLSRPFTPNKFHITMLHIQNKQPLQEITQHFSANLVPRLSCKLRRNSNTCYQLPALCTGTLSSNQHARCGTFDATHPTLR